MEARATRTLLPPYHPATRAVRRVGERIARVGGLCQLARAAQR